MLTFRLKIAFCFVFGIGTLITLYAIANGKDLFSSSLNPNAFTEMGRQRAREYFIEQGAETGSDEAVFGYAWATFTLGDYDGAEEACDHLLASDSLSKDIRAGCLYLRAHVYLNRSQFNLARQNFIACSDLYGPGSVGKLRSQLGMVRIHILTEEYDKAFFWLEQSKPGKDDPLNVIGYWWVLKKQYHFFSENDYESALEAALWAAEYYKESGNRSAYAAQLTSTGMFRMLLSDWVGGTFDVNYSKGILLGAKDHHELAYNAGPWYFRARCYEGISTFEREQAEADFQNATERAEETGDQHLARLLNFAKVCPCPY